MAIPGNLLSLTAETINPNTSGWTPVERCTLAVGSMSGYSTACVMTATATGEMQAATSAIYPVTVGQTYQTFADAASSTQPERIGIDWLGPTGASLSQITWSLTPSAAWSTPHRIGVAGVAPTGAVYARVIVSATTTTNGWVETFANVYLGAPIRTAGNLFSFDVESCGDLDTSGWTGELNATIGRVAPLTTFSPTTYTVGGESISGTSVSAGNMSIKATETPTVQPGREYIASCWIRPPTSTAVCWIELRWLTAAGALISAIRSTLSQNATNVYQQRASGIAPSNAAMCTLAVGITSAALHQAIWVDGAVVALAQPLEPGSVLPYSDASFEQGVGSWTVTSGVATIARSTPAGSGLDGSYALTVTSASATASVLTSARYPVTPGVNWRVMFTTSITSGGNVTYGPNVRYFDASGSAISATTADPVVISSGTGLWWNVWNDAVTPANAATAQIEITVTPSTTSTVVEIDSVALWETLPSFQATANAELGDVQIVLRDLDTSSAMTLYRLAGGTQALVRGPDGLLSAYPLAATQMVVEDYEAPLGIPVTYRADFVSVSTGLSDGSRTSESVTIPAPSDPSMMWIKDPQQPQRNVMLRASVAPDWSRDINQSVNLVRGRPNPVVLSDVRQGNAGTLQVWTLTDNERQAMDLVLDTGNVLLIQAVPGLGIDDTYVAVAQSSATRIVPGLGQPRRLWSLPITQVDQPVGGVGGTAGWTVQDVVSTYDTVLDVAQAYATVLDLVLDNRGS